MPESRDVIEKVYMWESSSDPKTATARKTTVLVEKLPEAVPRSGWLKVIVPDGELRRKGDSLIYTSPKSGMKRVSVFAAR